MSAMTVAIVGAGQLGPAVAERLGARTDVAVLGPAARESAVPLLTSGADVVIIAVR